jgi:large subunit ribosomal protein L23
VSDMKLLPHISEKAIASAEKGVYIFDVPAEVEKIEVAKAVEKAFGVNVISVNMLITKGKLKRMRRTFGRRSDQKKAMVKVKSGQKINLFEAA